MAQIIQTAESSSILVNTLTLADKTGTGNMTVQPPDNASYQFRGMRIATENHTTSYTIPSNKSGYVWTNTSGTTVTYTLPSPAVQGFMVYIVRVGGVITVTPGASDRIELGDHSIVKGNGVSVTMASSGSILGLIKDEGTRWTRFISFGTIS